MAQATQTPQTPQSALAHTSWPASSSEGFEYQPRSPEDTILHQVVVEHLETFLEEARQHGGGQGVPEFVERSFRKFIDCGCLAQGFARVRCTQCGFERLVPFSRKVRGLCASCSARRMMELSARVFSRARGGGLEFHPLETLTDEEVAELLTTVRHRVLRKLEREGLLDEDEASFQIDALSDESPALAGIYSAGVQGRVALGQRSGRRVMRIGADPSAPWVTSRTPLQAHLEGFI